MSTPDLVGRHADMAVLEAVLQETVAEPVAIRLVGEPGIGKTVLLRAVAERARELKLLTLVSRPSEIEAGAPFAALTDLLLELDDAIAALPAPQAQALRAATLRAAPAGDDIPPHIVSVAVRTLFASLGRSGRFIVIVDDAHWVDDASRAALRYAARRLPGIAVRWITASRSDADELELGQAIEPARVTVRGLAPLSAAALHGVIRRQLGTTLPRHLLVRITDASRGNPLHALELARAALLEGDLAPGRALPLSAGAGELLLRRVQALPSSTREALLLLAAMENSSIQELARAGGSAAIRALDAAEAEDLIVRSPSDVLFKHPLVAEAAYRAAAPPARRAAHLRLAEVTNDTERRARHLGRGTLEPGPDVAAALDRGANAAVARGALAAAAELSEMACRLTPPEDRSAQVERRLVLAQRVLDMGDSKRAAAEARDAIGLGPAGDARARARLVLANALRWTDGSDAAERELAEVEREPELSPLTLARVADLRGALASTESEAIEHYDKSIAYLRLADDPRFLAEQLLTRAEAAGWLGHGWDERVVEEARELERRAPARRVALNAETMQANALTWVDRLGEARLVYHAQLREAVARGEDASVMRLHMHLVRLELQAARWLDAEQHAVAYLEMARYGDDPGEEALALVRLAAVDAMLGREADARARLARGLAVAADIKFDYGVAVGWATLGLLDLSLGNSIPAAEALAAACELAARRGINDPGIFRNRGDLAEALVEAGRLDEAQTVADELLADAERLGRVRSVAAAKRAQALLASASGDTAAAIAAAERSVELLADTELPFDHARSLLAAGRVHRRARHKGEAHRLLLGAVAALEGLKAPLWAALARTELARVGLRPAAPASLTDTEAQVARLAARGLTNRQVADAAFLTPRSVEGVLRRIYNKLGISSRAELGAAMAAEADRPRSR